MNDFALFLMAGIRKNEHQDVHFSLVKMLKSRPSLGILRLEYSLYLHLAFFDYKEIRNAILNVSVQAINNEIVLIFSLVVQMKYQN